MKKKDEIEVCLVTKGFKKNQIFDKCILIIRKGNEI